MLDSHGLIADGWYLHKEFTGTMSVHLIEKEQGELPGEVVYETRAWPAQQPYPDRIMTEAEAKAFIHSVAGPEHHHNVRTAPMR